MTSHHVELELLTLSGQLRSLPNFDGFRVAQSLVFYVVFCVLLFVCLCLVVFALLLYNIDSNLIIAGLANLRFCAQITSLSMSLLSLNDNSYEKRHNKIKGIITFLDYFSNIIYKQFNILKRMYCIVYGFIKILILFIKDRFK